MALNKTTLQNSIKAIYQTLATYDGSAGKTQADAINKASADLATAIETFVKSAQVTITPAHVTAGALSNGGGPVVAANNIVVSGGIS